MYYWSYTDSTWVKTSCIRVCSDNSNIVRLQANIQRFQLNIVFTQVERQGRHVPAPAVAVSDARQAAAASGAMRVDQDEEVEDEKMLHEFQNKTFVPWLQGLSVSALDDLGEAKGTILAYELEKLLMSKFWQ